MRWIEYNGWTICVKPHHLFPQNQVFTTQKDGKEITELSLLKIKQRINGMNRVGILPIKKKSRQGFCRMCSKCGVLISYKGSMGVIAGNKSDSCCNRCELERRSNAMKGQPKPNTFRKSVIAPVKIKNDKLKDVLASFNEVKTSFQLRIPAETYKGWTINPAYGTINNFIATKDGQKLIAITMQRLKLKINAIPIVSQFLDKPSNFC